MGPICFRRDNLYDRDALTDASGVGSKTWNFYNAAGAPPWSIGVLSGFIQRASPSGTIYRDDRLDWWVDPSGHPYVAAKTSVTDPGTPQNISTQDYGESFTYTSSLAVTSATGLNGEQLYLAYDQYGRPTSGTSPYGAVTTHAYGAYSLPLTQMKSGPDGATVTTTDGVGHVVRVSGPGGIVDSVYAPCACSPMGKLQKVSQPYAAGTAPGNIKWTSYVYDGLGRTVNAVEPDGATVYVYAGNGTTVSDAAGKWKYMWSDVEGNLVKVIEPDPANAPGGTLTTSYTYDWMKNLVGVSMPRGGVTQTRSFVYDAAGRLTSATNPENGTVSYGYNVDNTVQYKHDARGQDTVYTYDSAKRVTMVQRFPGGRSGAEDTCQRVSYSYDANPYDGSYSRYVTGRLAAAAYTVCGLQNGQNAAVTEMYSYHPAGGVSGKRMHLDTPFYTWQDDTWRNDSTNVDIAYSYTGWGALSSITLPSARIYNNPDIPNSGAHIGQVTYSYSFDGLGRPVSMQDNSPDSANGFSTIWAQNAQYDFAGRLTGYQARSGKTSYSYCDCYTDNYETASRTYDALGHLTGMGWSVGPSVQYLFSAAYNNGQISQVVDSGETITYQYDVVRRLIAATSSSAGTQTFQYDGFGNLTGKVVNGTTTAIAVNGATNRLVNAGYDANGNMTSGAGGSFGYDVANRMIWAAELSGGTQRYGYGPDNKRVYRGALDGSAGEWTVWGARGEKLGVFTLECGVNAVGYCGYIAVVSPTLRFAGQTIWSGGAMVKADRLGSNRAGGSKFLAYGEEVGSSSGDRIKFGSYTRDGFTGMDYADQRYYASSYGRFNSADPYQASGGASDPSSWNRYAYVGGDPINYGDQRGLIKQRV